MPPYMVIKEASSSSANISSSRLWAKCLPCRRNCGNAYQVIAAYLSQCFTSMPCSCGGCFCLDSDWAEQYLPVGFGCTLKNPLLYVPWLNMFRLCRAANLANRYMDISRCCNYEVLLLL